MLVGRERELKVLHGMFARVSAQKICVLLVAGEPGIGKSALVNEIHKPVVARRGYFIAGKYDPLRQNIPFSAVIQAVQGLVRQLLSETEDRIALWKEKLLEALGPNGRVMTDIIAGIELIIGKQPEVPELPPEEAQNRFKMVLKKIFSVFAHESHPLMLFLDDLQWADPGSIDLIQTLVLNRELRNFMLLGAYRDNEIGAHHPLMLARDRMLAANVDLAIITLKALNQDSINCLLAEFLHCDQERSKTLANIVHQKTLGNPFFINQFLKRLYEQRYLTLTPSMGWQWDAAIIENMQVTENVVEFMAEKLLKLPSKSHRLIKIAACIGNRFNVETLVAVSESSMEAVLDTIDTLTEEGLINFSNHFYLFHHDRIQEAAYSLIDEEGRAQLHYRIGRLALEQTSGDQLVHKVFYIADQFNSALSQIQSPEERLRLARVNLTAGVKAKEATAYEAAVTYLTTGIELLPKQAWRSDSVCG